MDSTPGLKATTTMSQPKKHLALSTSAGLLTALICHTHSFIRVADNSYWTH